MFGWIALIFLIEIFLIVLYHYLPARRPEQLLEKETPDSLLLVLNPYVASEIGKIVRSYLLELVFDGTQKEEIPFTLGWSQDVSRKFTTGLEILQVSALNGNFFVISQNFSGVQVIKNGRIHFPRLYTIQLDEPSCLAVSESTLCKGFATGEIQIYNKEDGKYISSWILDGAPLRLCYCGQTLYIIRDSDISLVALDLTRGIWKYYPSMGSIGQGELCVYANEIFLVREARKDIEVYDRETGELTSRIENLNNIRAIAIFPPSHLYVMTADEIIIFDLLIRSRTWKWAIPSSQIGAIVIHNEKLNLFGRYSMLQYTLVERHLVNTGV